jgi:hypothetical protein
MLTFSIILTYSNDIGGLMFSVPATNAADRWFVSLSR